MKKKYIILFMILIVSVISYSQSKNPNLRGHIQSGNIIEADNYGSPAAFDNPNYYYAAIKIAPTGVFYRQASLSPNGQKIVAQKSYVEGSYSRTEIVLMNANGTGEIVISAGNSGEGDIYGYMNPFWSDDGLVIGFAQVYNTNPNKIVRYVISTATSSYIYEPVAPLDASNPDFLGNSTTSIIFWDWIAADNAADLYIWDGSTRTNITNSTNYSEYEPVSNPNGTKILYWSGETTTEPINTTHTLTLSGGIWTKDVGFTPIADSYWPYWSTKSDNYIDLTVMSSGDVHIYSNTGTFVLDLTGPGYSGGSGQWNFFGNEGLNGEFIMTSNAGRTTSGRDIVFAMPRTILYVNGSTGSDIYPGTQNAPFATIGKAITEANNGSIINVAAGTYVEGTPQIIINKNISIVGADKNTTIIKPSTNTGGSGDSRGWFLVNSGFAFNLSNVTLDGTGKQIFMAVLSHGTGTINNNIVKNMFYSSYYGMGLMMYGGNFTISNNTISNIGRIGMYANGTGVTNGIFTGNTYTGKGVGDWLDYGIELENGAHATINNNTITNCKGVTINDGSTSSGMYLSTYFALGTTGTYTSNTITNNSYGITIGYDAGDQSTAIIHNNNISGNTDYGVYSTAPTVDAANNWWGSVTGPKHSTDGGVTWIPSNGGDKVSNNITYNPWTGSTSYPADVIPCTVGTHNLTNSNPGGSIQFNSVGTNNINPSISVQRHDGLPNVPAYAGTAAPVYFVITPTNLANYTFEATITIDVSAIPGFNGNTVIMMSPDGINNWVGVNGTYNSSAHTFTFTTSHFSTIAFVNPVLDNILNLYVSTSTSAYSSTIYPNTSWNTPLTTSNDGFDWVPANHEPDWTYKIKSGTFYLIPVGSSTNPRSFYEAHIKVAWNPNVISGVTINPGNLFPGGTFLQNINMGNGTAQIDYASLNGNHTPDGQLYLAKIDFNFDNDTSGFSPIAIQDVTIYYDNGQSGWENAMVVTQGMGGKFKLYLGDFASTSPASLYTGDGLIDATDLTTSGFTLAYWSNWNDPSTTYKSKFDIGPTLPARYYFGLPHPDGVINFEDLAVFAMGYSKTGSGSLPDNPKPIIFSLDKIARDANGTLRLPVRISGGINDVRAYSMKIKYGSDMEYTGVEMAGEMLQGTKFLIGKSESGKAFMDGAVIGAFESGLSKEGVIAYVIFNEKIAGNHSASIESVIARNSSNLDLDVSFDGMNNGLGVPKTFNLSQNYPNPFNPVTKIEYAVPNDVKVTLKIYDVLGREVNVLVNEVKKAGYYSVEWNGSSLSSGIYFYQMKAGDFVAVKKMMMIK